MFLPKPNETESFYMSYITLKKAFYNPNIDANALYKDRFGASNAIHLDISISGNPAFFILEESLYAHMLRITQADKKILSLTLQLPGKAIQQFTERTLIDEIVLTNNIEGVNSSRREIENILKNLEKRDKRNRFFGIVNKYVLLTQKVETPLNTPKDIRAIYDDLVLDEVVSSKKNNTPDGKLFRKNSTSIYNAAGQEIHRGIDGEQKIENYLLQTLGFLKNSGIELPIRVAIAHYLIGYIHPFYDGNGRLNRFISSALLLKEYEPLVGIRLSYAITQSIDKYYKGFDACNDVLNRGDLTPFLFMFLGIIKEAVDDIVKVLTEKRDLLELNRQRLERVDDISNDRHVLELADLLLQARMFSGTGVTISELMDICDISRPTAMKRLERINAARLLQRERMGREAHVQIDLDALANMAR